jgi:hypothetical protein
MDVKYTGLYETGVGDFDVNFSMVDMDKDESEAFYNGPVVNFVGLTATPNYRYTMDVGHALKAMPELYLTIQYEYIDEWPIVMMLTMLEQVQLMSGLKLT